MFYQTAKFFRYTLADGNVVKLTDIVGQDAVYRIFFKGDNNNDVFYCGESDVTLNNKKGLLIKGSASYVDFPVSEAYDVKTGQKKENKLDISNLYLVGTQNDKITIGIIY